ncbi:MAG: hypothetical protein ACKVP0_20430 [Pirellulaceae bacterium]
MGEENRGSSGSSPVMIVVAILGGLLLVGCCGGVVVVGAGFFLARTAARDAAMEFDRVNVEVQESKMEMKQLNEEMKETLDAIKIPDAIPEIPPAESAPAITPPSSEVKKE